mgnify:CR=1 FL=1
MTAAVALTWRQYRLERRMFWRNPSAAFFNFVLPLLFLALFGAIFSGSQQDLDIIVRLAESDRANPSSVLRLPLVTARGSQVPLSSVASVVASSEPNQINRANR